MQKQKNIPRHLLIFEKEKSSAHVSRVEDFLLMLKFIIDFTFYLLFTIRKFFRQHEQETRLL